MVRKKRLHFPSYIERTSAFVSKGSVMVETALAMPLFCIAMLSLSFLLEMMQTQIYMRGVFYDASRELAKEAYASDFLWKKRLENKIKEKTKGEIEVDCSLSRKEGETSIFHLIFEYDIPTPLGLFHQTKISYRESLCVKGWTGYEGEGWLTAKEGYVYVTENGIVYHSTKTCPYLDISIFPRAIKEAKKELYPCSLCGENSSIQGIVFVTRYGQVYHTKINCSAINRTVYPVKKSQVYGKGGCSKCVK